MDNSGYGPAAHACYPCNETLSISRGLQLTDAPVALFTLGYHCLAVSASLRLDLRKPFPG